MLALNNQLIKLAWHTDSLIPFTHWITPVTFPRRFTTQMYLCFLPLEKEPGSDFVEDVVLTGEHEVQIPTPDGGIEIAEARFLPAKEWLRLAKIGEIIMFPPQVLLLTIIAQFLDNSSELGFGAPVPKTELSRRRAALLKFVHSGTPPWTQKYISPRSAGRIPDGRQIFLLDYAGPELEGSGKQGEPDRVVLARFTKEGPREVAIHWRKDGRISQYIKSKI